MTLKFYNLKLKKARENETSAFDQNIIFWPLKIFEGPDLVEYLNHPSKFKF